MVLHRLLHYVPLLLIRSSISALANNSYAHRLMICGVDTCITFTTSSYSSSAPCASATADKPYPHRLTICGVET